MSQWKSYASANGSPKWGASIMQQGSGASNKAANVTSLFTNTTPGAWLVHGAICNEVDGMFPVTPLNKANTSGESKKIHSLGWALRTNSEGPITGLSAANGSGFANGDTVTVSGGSVNAIVVLTTNATGNLVSAVVRTSSNTGLFANVSSTSAGFNRDTHLAANLTVTGTAGGAIGNSNTYNITIAANSTNLTPWSINAFGTFTANATGGVTNAVVNAITWQLGNNAGIFGNATSNAGLVYTVTNAANNGVITGLTFTANVTTSTGGAIAVTTLGGRSGRVTYEVLAVNRHIGVPLANVTTTANGSGYTNTDYVIVSGGGSTQPGQYAKYNVTNTTATGGLTNTSFTLVNPGAFPNTTSALTITVYAANGATSNGAANAATMAATRFLTGANTTQLPQ